MAQRSDPRVNGSPATGPQVAPRRSKAESLAMVASLKRQILVGSVVGFGVFAALAAGQAASASGQSGSTSGQGANSSQGSDDSGSQSSNGGFFNQQGGSPFGSGSSGGGHAVSGSGVS